MRGQFHLQLFSEPISQTSILCYPLTSSIETLHILSVHLLFLPSGLAYRNILYSTILTILGNLIHHEVPSHVMA
jgi:hypothetical protein